MLNYSKMTAIRSSRKQLLSFHREIITQLHKISNLRKHMVKTPKNIFICRNTFSFWPVKFKSKPYVNHDISTIVPLSVMCGANGKISAIMLRKLYVLAASDVSTSFRKNRIHPVFVFQDFQTMRNIHNNVIWTEGQWKTWKENRIENI